MWLLLVLLLRVLLLLCVQCEQLLLQQLLQRIHVDLMMMLD